MIYRLDLWIEEIYPQVGVVYLVMYFFDLGVGGGGLGGLDVGGREGCVGCVIVGNTLVQRTRT